MRSPWRATILAIDYSVFQYGNEDKIWGEFSHYDYLHTVSHIEAARGFTKFCAPMCIVFIITASCSATSPSRAACDYARLKQSLIMGPAAGLHGTGGCEVWISASDRTRGKWSFRRFVASFTRLDSICIHICCLNSTNSTLHHPDGTSHGNSGRMVCHSHTLVRCQMLGL